MKAVRRKYFAAYTAPRVLYNASGSNVNGTLLRSNCVFASPIRENVRDAFAARCFVKAFRREKIFTAYLAGRALCNASDCSIWDRADLTRFEFKSRFVIVVCVAKIFCPARWF